MPEIDPIPRLRVSFLFLLSLATLSVISGQCFGVIGLDHDHIEIVLAALWRHGTDSSSQKPKPTRTGCPTEFSETTTYNQPAPQSDCVHRDGIMWITYMYRKWLKDCCNMLLLKIYDNQPQQLVSSQLNRIKYKVLQDRFWGPWTD